ncbi:MAG: hypothetical protein ABSG63_06155 [Spirochaetia bacterium]
MARLARLLGTDEGLFLLALHSFVESFISDVFPSGKYAATFPQLLWDFEEFLKRKGGAGRIAPQDAQAIMRISREHPAAKKVRHGFQTLGRRAWPHRLTSWGSAACARSCIPSWTPWPRR